MDRPSLPGPAHSVSTSEGGSCPSPASRPLSDIRELTEPSVRVPHLLSRRTRARSRANSHRANVSSRRSSFDLAVDAPRTGGAPSSSSEYSSTPDRLSFFAIPQTSVPRRSSSQTQRGRSQHVQKPPAHCLTIPNRGCGRSPVKDVGLRLAAATSDSTGRVQSETIVRNPHPVDILDFPYLKHPRLRLEIHLSAPIFTGGATIEGFVKCVVDSHERFSSTRSLALRALLLDLIGFEDVGSSRRTSFLSLRAELVDTNHPPPFSMARSARPAPDRDGFRPLAPSISNVPFCLNLPLDTGPPPFRSRHGSIRFVLSATAIIREASRYYNVRVSEDIEVLPTYDPEKILASLPVPLTTSDELRWRKYGTYQSVSITAGLHRQTWVSGNSLFADVHISNRSRKTISRVQLNLERYILCHKYAATSTAHRHASGGRVIQDRHRAILKTSEVRTKDTGWHGVDAYASDTRTVVLEIPRGHATVLGRRYFEVQFFLNVTVFISRSRVIALQLPVTIVHINSVDALPNSVAQVAAAIEERRGHKVPRQTLNRHLQHRHSSPERSISPPIRNKPHKATYNHGEMFAAPRKDWMARHQAEKEELLKLGQAIDSSPRRYRPGTAAAACKSGGHVRRQPELSERPRNGMPLGYRYHEGPRKSSMENSRPQENETERVLERYARIKPSFESLRSILTGRAHRKVKESISVPHIRTPKAILGPHSLGMAANVAGGDENSRLCRPKREVDRRPSHKSWRGDTDDSMKPKQESVDGRGRYDEPGWI